MPHIHTEPGQHDLTASAFVVRTDGGEPRIMLHMHRKIGKLMHFGGHVELDESPWATVTHELKEESGYNLNQLKTLQPKDRIKRQLTGAVMHPVPASYITVPYVPGSDHFHTDTAFAFVTDQAPQHPVEDGESEDFRLLTAGELRALHPDEIIENVREISLAVLEDIFPTWEQIPATNWEV